MSSSVLHAHSLTLADFTSAGEALGLRYRGGMLGALGHGPCLEFNPAECPRDPIDVPPSQRTVYWEVVPHTQDLDTDFADIVFGSYVDLSRCSDVRDLQLTDASYDALAASLSLQYVRDGAASSPRRTSTTPATWRGDNGDLRASYLNLYHKRCLAQPTTITMGIVLRNIFRSLDGEDVGQLDPERLRNDFFPTADVPLVAYVALDCAVVHALNEHARRVRGASTQSTVREGPSPDSDASSDEERVYEKRAKCRWTTWSGVLPRLDPSARLRSTKLGNSTVQGRTTLYNLMQRRGLQVMVHNFQICVVDTSAAPN